LPPNTALELTPQSGEQDRGHFESWFHSTAMAIYQCGAAQRQAVGRHSHLFFSSQFG
jgi:hypothetical protein